MMATSNCYPSLQPELFNRNPTDFLQAFTSSYKIQGLWTSASPFLSDLAPSQSFMRTLYSSHTKRWNFWAPIVLRSWDFTRDDPTVSVTTVFLYIAIFLGSCPVEGRHLQGNLTGGTACQCQPKAADSLVKGALEVPVCIAWAYMLAVMLPGCHS